MALDEPPGVATADRLVQLAEGLGVIERQEWDPSVEFRFPGGRSLRKRADQHSRPVEFGYVVGPRVDLVPRLVEGHDLDEDDFAVYSITDEGRVYLAPTLSRTAPSKGPAVQGLTRCKTDE
jgi:hypothetical protein